MVLRRSHTSFLLQEAVQSIRDNYLKAHVAFLDAQQAFDTVWHEGLFVKPISSDVLRYLLELLIGTGIHILSARCSGTDWLLFEIRP